MNLQSLLRQRVILTKKAGDASDKSYLATTTDTPAYLHTNRICYEEYDGRN